MVVLIMKIVSWNVAGLRACYKKGFQEVFESLDADIFCLQEVKCTLEELPFKKEGYEYYLNAANKKGYSGTLIYSRLQPLKVTYGLGISEHDQEGRVITLEFNDFYLVNAYVPNSKKELERLDYRMIWEDAMRTYLKKLDEHKPVILCGDLNVAHEEIDIKNPAQNRRSAGFTIEERNKMTELLNSGFIDTFRYLYPDKVLYTWWSYLFHARERNAGWRIDYFIISERLKDKLKDSIIHTEIYGSDHCPIEVRMEI